jgi:hypothetical protein
MDEQEKKSKELGFCGKLASDILFIHFFYNTYF